MIAKVMRGGDTYRLLQYLYGPGRANEHADPHLVGAWRELGVPDPGREEDRSLRELASRLDCFVRRGAPRPVWHCAVRAAPEDRSLTDGDWGRICRRLVSVAGVAPEGDGFGCRWVAVRHDGEESRHVHVVATLARQDDRRPNIHNDALRLRDECRRLERELGLRVTSESNRTSAKLPQRGETEKASRRDLLEAPRSTLARQARAAAVAAVGEEDFFALLESSGILVRRRSGTGGRVEGYSVSLPGDENPEGEPIWFGGGSLAPDLSLMEVRRRFAGDDGDGPGLWEEAWADLVDALRRCRGEFEGSPDSRRSATASALGDVLTAMAGAVPSSLVLVVGEAARRWEHAGRLPVPREDHAGAVELRRLARGVAREPGAAGRGGVLSALSEALPLMRELCDWYRARGWGPQEYAASRAVDALAGVLAG